MFLAALHASDALSNVVAQSSEFEADRRAVDDAVEWLATSDLPAHDRDRIATFASALAGE